MPAYSSYSDAELTLLLGTGDKEAYAEIYNRYHTVLYLHACRKLQDREDARDVVQELFTRLWFKRGDLQATTNLPAYLYVSVRNRIFDLLARKKTASEYLTSLQSFIDQGDYLPDRLVREKELGRLIEGEIASLPPKMRRIFELSRKEHLTHRQIAGQLNLSEQTVKKQVANALKILRIKLGTLLGLLLLFVR